VPLKPGQCAACSKLIWRVAIQQKEQNGVPAGTVVLLWPDPQTIYASFWTPTGQTQPIGYCRGCAPELGDQPPDGLTSSGEPFDVGGCIGHERPHERYSQWFSDRWGEWLSAHLRDQLGYDDEGAKAITEQWERDRVTT